MRPAPAVLGLVLLLALPALAQQAPNLSLIEAPRYSVGDWWQYRVVFIAGAANATAEAQTFPQDQTVRVQAAETFQGQEAFRLFTESVQDIPGDAQSGDLHATSNKTTWVTAQGQRILRIEEAIDRTQATAQYRITTHREVNWTFHEPMDLYQFPIVRDDTWVVLTNATVESNTTIRTHVQGNPPSPPLPPRYEAGNITQASSTTWVRQDRLNLSDRFYDGVVLVSQSGNATIRDFYSPQVGNLVRREILNESAVLVETSTLVGYRYANAPAPPGGNSPGGNASWLPLAGAAVVGIGVALGVLFVLGKVRRPPSDGPEPPPPAPPAQEPPPETPPGSPPAGGEP